MSLRFLADQCIPGTIIRGLEEAGHVVIPLRKCARIDSPDPTVIAKAQELDCILISLNGDFSDIVSYPPSRYRGVL